MTTSRRIIDPTMVPKGPHGEFARQLCDQVDELVSGINNVRVDAVEAAEEVAAGPFQRVKACVNTPTTPFVVDPKIHKHNCRFDDVGASAETGILLPTLAEIAAAGIDRETECYSVGFKNTSGQTMEIRAAAGTTIKADGIAQSADGGALELYTTGAFALLTLYDDQWRAESLAGEFGIVA